MFCATRRSIQTQQMDLIAGSVSLSMILLSGLAVAAVTRHAGISRANLVFAHKV
jgi:hypothetical protein